MYKVFTVQIKDLPGMYIVYVDLGCRVTSANKKIALINFHAVFSTRGCDPLGNNFTSKTSFNFMIYIYYLA